MIAMDAFHGVTVAPRWSGFSTALYQRAPKQNGRVDGSSFLAPAGFDIAFAPVLTADTISVDLNVVAGDPAVGVMPPPPPAPPAPSGPPPAAAALSGAAPTTPPTALAPAIAPSVPLPGRTALAPSMAPSAQLHTPATGRALGVSRLATVHLRTRDVARNPRATPVEPVEAVPATSAVVWDLEPKGARHAAQTSTGLSDSSRCPP